MYQVVVMIQDRFFKKGQDKNSSPTFVLFTHNIYFLQRLIAPLLRSKEKFLLQRVKKAKDNVSEVEKMDSQDIQNEYQMLWQLIRDYQNDTRILPNLMRQILEYFFAFIAKAPWQDFVNDGSFELLLNDRSHHKGTQDTYSDRKNPPSSKMMSNFKQVFGRPWLRGALCQNDEKWLAK